MVTLQLQKVLYKQIHSCFDMKENMEVQIQNTFSLKVNYTEGNKGCYATLESISRATSAPEIFSVNVELVGIFSCDGIKRDEDKQSAHVQVYNYLFPYVQSMVADLSGKAGLPPLMLEMAKIDPLSVNIG